MGAKGPSYPEMAKEAVGKALQDAKLPFEAVEAAVSSQLIIRGTQQGWVADTNGKCALFFCAVLLWSVVFCQFVCTAFQPLERWLCAWGLYQRTEGSL